MTRKEKKEELIGLFCTGAIFIGDLIDECFDFGQQQQHWISVEDELPKEDENVLVSINGSVFYGCWLGGEMWAIARQPLEEKPNGDVTNWMPIPEPPVVSKSGTACIIGTADHIKIALDVMERKGGEK